MVLTLTEARYAAPPTSASVPYILVLVWGTLISTDQGQEMEVLQLGKTVFGKELKETIKHFFRLFQYNSQTMEQPLPLRSLSEEKISLWFYQRAVGKHVFCGSTVSVWLPKMQCHYIFMCTYLSLQSVPLQHGPSLHCACLGEAEATIGITRWCDMLHSTLDYIVFNIIM